MSREVSLWKQIQRQEQRPLQELARKGLSDETSNGISKGWYGRQMVDILSVKQFVASCARIA